MGRRPGEAWAIWGMWTVIATEAALFAYLLFSYFYLGAQGSPGWLLEPHPSLKYALPSTAARPHLGAFTWWGVRGALRRPARDRRYSGSAPLCFSGAPSSAWKSSTGRRSRTISALRAMHRSIS